jgi:hypothetical protein
MFHLCFCAHYRQIINYTKTQCSKWIILSSLCINILPPEERSAVEKTLQKLIRENQAQ